MKCALMRIIIGSGTGSTSQTALMDLTIASMMMILTVKKVTMYAMGLVKGMVVRLGPRELTHSYLLCLSILPSVG